MRAWSSLLSVGSVGLGCWLLTVASPVLAQEGICAGSVLNEVFCDDFSDGDHTDGMPVTWEFAPGLGVTGIADSSSGDLVITQPNRDPQVMYTSFQSLADMSIQSRIRQVDGSGPIAVYGRLDVANLTGYQGGIDTNNGTLYLGRNDSPSPSTLVSAPTDLNPSTEDIILQLDILGDELSLFAWRATDPKPETPALTATDDLYDSGFAALLIDAPAQHSVSFSYVRVATSSIPEPGSFLLLTGSVLGLVAMRPRASNRSKH